MTIIERANNLIISAISKVEEIYEALWGKEDFTPAMTISDANDYNCGAVANQFEYLYNDFIGALTEEDLELMDPDLLDLIVLFFADVLRYSDLETNTQLIDRLFSFTYKQGQTPWATPWSILKSIGYYVDEDNLYYIPNAVETDLLTNGNFEDAIGAEWTFTPSGDRSTGDAFSGTYKVDFTMTSLEQTVSLTAATYVFHCFAKGTAGDLFYVTFQRSSDNFYFNTETLIWEAAPSQHVFNSTADEYELCTRYLIVDGSYDVIIKFNWIADFLLDRVQLGEIEYPSFEILYTDSGFGQGFASVWDGVSTNYPLASYIAQDFMFETTAGSVTATQIQTVLDILRPAGVKGIFNNERRIV